MKARKNKFYALLCVIILISSTISVPVKAAKTDSYTASDILSQINVGYNIGNSLDSCPTTGRNNGSRPVSYYETVWGNPVISAEYIDTIIANGFNAIRLPVTWYYNTYVSSDNILMIRGEWLQRVAEVIDYAISRDVYVILDSHHDAPIIWADMNDIAIVAKNVAELWSQIATYFRDYDEHLIFESFNEINTKNDSWRYGDSYAQATNILNQCFVSAVRNAGYQNSERILLCSTYLSETSQQILDSYVLPVDTVQNKLAVSVHCYEASYNQDIEALFTSLDAFRTRIGVPVVITEFGTTSSFIPAEYRASHAANYIARANEHNIKCFWWDDGGKYKLINRKNNSIYAPDVVYALNHPLKFETSKSAYYLFNDISSYSYGILDQNTGALMPSSRGYLTLNPNSIGVPVNSGYSYQIKLTNEYPGDGIRMTAIAFLDNHEHLLTYTALSDKTIYDVTAPSNAAYMRITFYNPWGYRSLKEYTSYLNNGFLYMEVTEYLK